jgi:hypothetical protein
MTQLTTRRVAVKVHRCSMCPAFIRSGSTYLRHTSPARYNDTGRWGSALLECSMCATRHGRAGLLEEKESK